MSSVNVVSRTQRLVVEPASKTVSVVNAGPVGPGVGGGPGTTGATISYVDSEVALALSTANAYTDVAEADAIAAANAYTDTAEADAISAANAYTDAAKADIVDGYTSTGQLVIDNGLNDALKIDATTNRPYISFHGRDATLTPVRNGYVGYFDADHAGAAMRVVSDRGTLFLGSPSVVRSTAPYIQSDGYMRALGQSVAVARKSANQELSTSETITWGTADINQGTDFSTANNRYTAPRDGTYFVVVKYLANNGTGDVRIRKNGAEYTTGIAGFGVAGNGTSNSIGIATGFINLDAGDYIDARAAAGGTTWTIYGDTTQPHTTFCVYELIA